MERLSGTRASRAWIVGLLILGAVVTWLVVNPSRQSPGKEVTVADPDASSTVAEALQSHSDVPATGRVPVAVASSETVACVEQFLDVTAQEKQQRSCVSRTQTITTWQRAYVSRGVAGGAVRLTARSTRRAEDSPR